MRDTTSVLATLLDRPLVVVDVGCRWGFADVWDRLGNRCHIIGFDPDQEECANLSELYRGRPEIRLVPLGLGAEPGPATLYVTKDPGGCSLYPPAPDAFERHPAIEGGRLERTRIVEVTKLDDWCEQEGIDRIDVIKIDTQGSELDILHGGSGVLDTVRAVEVEVEFNELYEGIPLFGDIDRYLRERGFLLWKFRDLAHHSQYGAPRDWHAREQMYFDEEIVGYLAGSGQLFWANAFYLRREAARPSADAGWEQLVRDACVASAWGFHDLVTLGLKQARASAPPSAVTDLEMAASDDLIAAHREQDLAERSLFLEGTHLVDFARPLMGWGWRAPQQLEFAVIRWTGPAREASIDIPFMLKPGTRIELLAVTAMSPAILLNLELEVNRVPVALSRSVHLHGSLFVAMVPDDYWSTRRYTRLVLRTIETIPWNELHPGSSNDTELGVAVAWVRLTGPGPDTLGSAL